MKESKHIRTFLFLYTAFIIYGSLIPLDFHMVPLSSAIESFKNIQYLDLKIGSRADWVSNLLLFIPLSFLFYGYLITRKKESNRLFITITTFLFCSSLSLAIEFTQIYFPQRTVSINDIIAESTGSLIGIFVWYLYGRRSLQWLHSWNSQTQTYPPSKRLLLLYLGLLYGYNLLPLDLTISPVEIYHSWKEGRILLIPFSSTGSTLAEQLYEIITDSLLWAPVSFLLIQCSKRTPSKVFLLTVIAACFLELAQLFIYSRITDTTDIITASIGAMLGITTASLLFNPTKFTQSKTKNISNMPLIFTQSIFYVGWTIFTGLVFWYPYNFNADIYTIKIALDNLSLIPLYNYYYGSEYRAITEVFRKVIFFIPYGAIPAFLHYKSKGIVALSKTRHFVILSAIFAAAAIESGQLFLPEKFADITDFWLEIFGALLGYYGVLKIANPIQTGKDNNLTSIPQINFPFNAQYLLTTPIVIIGIGTFCFISLGTLIVGMESLPYNIKELFSDGSTTISLFFMSTAFFWGFGSLTILAVWFINSERYNSRVASLPVILAGHAVIMYFLLRISVPIESLHDILGSPILNWPWEWELLIRFVCIFSALSLCLSYSASLWINQPPFYSFRYKVKARWSIAFIILLPPLHWCVVDQAATDNLTELMRNNGSYLTSILFTIFLIIIGTISSMVSASFAQFIPHKRLSLVLATLSVLPAYLILNLGTEPHIQKYGQTFSALQFLLSTDRANLSNGMDLFYRYTAGHLGLITIISFSQLPFWLILTRKRDEWTLSRKIGSEKNSLEKHRGNQTNTSPICGWERNP